MVIESLKKYIQNPHSAEANFEMGMAYYRMKHYSSALTYFHRAAELSNDPLLEYKCMILCSNALYHRGNRPHQVKGFALHAISILPKRPEAWFIYTRILEICGDWQECYSMTCSSLLGCDFDVITFEGSEYPGKYGIMFEKAISSWNIGRLKECIDTLEYMKENYAMYEGYTNLVQSNLTNLRSIYEKTL
jgi:tetratricopeptide (TPR) repeat protein